MRLECLLRLVSITGIINKHFDIRKKVSVINERDKPNYREQIRKCFNKEVSPDNMFKSVDGDLHKTSKYGKLVHLLPLHIFGITETDIIGTLCEV